MASVFQEHPLREAVTAELHARTAVTMAIDACAMPERDNGELAALFDGNPVIGSEAVGGLARVWSDFRIDADGFVRILVHDCSLSVNQAGRLAQRILEINCPAAARATASTAYRGLADLIRCPTFLFPAYCQAGRAASSVPI
jgi:hypothetical protein